MAIMAIILTGVLVAFSRTGDNIAGHILDERAASVASRRLELLLANRQEPNGLELQGRDEWDPSFTWRLNLSREVIGGERAARDFSNTVIQAVVTVEHSGWLGQSEPLCEMVRYFADLTPVKGQTIAVPPTSEEPEELWYLELQQNLGREPTMEEVIAEMARLGFLSGESLDLLQPMNGQE